MFGNSICSNETFEKLEETHKTLKIMLFNSKLRKPSNLENKHFYVLITFILFYGDDSSGCNWGLIYFSGFVNTMDSVA